MTAGTKHTVISFDCYGTLIDISAIRAAWLYNFAVNSSEVDPPPGFRLAARWTEIQLELVQERWRPYRDVIDQASARLAREQGWTWKPSDAEELIALTGAAQPFAEVLATLKALKRIGIRLAIVSNTDEAIMEHTLRQLPVSFDAIVTAEQCKAYKPSPKLMQRLIEQLALRPDQVLHVAAGYIYDIPTATQLGCSTVWVNRIGAACPGPVQPTYEFTDLRPLIGLI